MARLVFTADAHLREQTGGSEVGVLSRVVEGRDGTLARLVAAQAEHDIAPPTTAGWAFELRDAAGGCSGGYRPFRLRHGGRLRVGEATASLHGSPWSHEGWAFSTPDGRTVEATVAAPGARPSPRDGRCAVAGGRSRTCAVVLDATGSLGAVLELADVLALGCWLIVRWHCTPVIDHVLAAASADEELAGRPYESALAGMRAQTAN
jgi:hypothetical protein